METYLKSKKIGRRASPQDHAQRARIGPRPHPLSLSGGNEKIWVAGSGKIRENEGAGYCI